MSSFKAPIDNRAPVGMIFMFVFFIALMLLFAVWPKDQADRGGNWSAAPDGTQLQGDTITKPNTRLPWTPNERIP